MQVDDILTKIDAFFENKKSSETNIMFFTLALFIAFIAYNYFYPPAEQFYKTKKDSFSAIIEQVNAQQSYLNSVTINGDKNFHVKKIKKDIENSKIKLERTAYTNGYVDNKLKELSYLLFNDRNWARFLDNITSLAAKYDVELIKISNEFNEPSLQKIEQILNVTLEIKGGFKNIMKFLNAIEESRLVVDVHELNIEGKGELEGSIKIAVWGMKY